MTCGHPHFKFFSKCDECGELVFPKEGHYPNYFELFDLKPSYFLNEQLLKEKYYELSKNLHPDKFQTKSPEAIILVTRYSALMNKAFKTLMDKDERAYYLLEMDQNSPIQQKASLPPTLAEEYFNLQEALDENEIDSAARRTLVSDFSTLLEREILKQDDLISQSFQDSEKSKARESLQQKSYLKSMKLDLEKKWLK